MTFYIRKIDVKLDTNIPDHPFISLKSSILYHPLLKDVGSLDEYPFFTMDGYYPVSVLNNMSYKDKVRFFFNKSKMEYILKKHSTPYVPEEIQAGPTPKDQETVDRINEKEIQKISEQNIMTMLRCLFPTKYPYKSNTISSFNYIYNVYDLYIDPLDALPDILKPLFVKEYADYSYFKINGKVYTITQSIWLNDIYNHIEYKDLINKLLKLEEFKRNEKKKAEEDKTKKYGVIREKYRGHDKNRIGNTGSKFDILKKVKDVLQIIKDSKQSGRTVITISEETKVKEAENLINKMIENSKKLEDANEENEEMINLMSEIVENNKALGDSSFRNYYAINNDIKKYIEGMEKDVKEIRFLEYVLDILNKNGIVMSFENDNPEFKDKFNSKYQIYTNFISNIKKFNSPLRNSSNANFQKLFDEFINNTEQTGIFNYILNPMNSKDKYDMFQQKLGDNFIREVMSEEFFTDVISSKKNTGVSILSSANENDPYYEIYVQINTIGGELNDTNYTIIDCMYKGEYLGDNLEYLLNSSFQTMTGLNSIRIFFDITQGDAKDLIDIKTEKKAKKEEAKTGKAAVAEEPGVPEESGIKTGGKKRFHTLKISNVSKRDTRKRFMNIIRKY
jgi:hypothetical protein